MAERNDAAILRSLVGSNRAKILRLSYKNPYIQGNFLRQAPGKKAEVKKAMEN